jgi:predicted permease
MLRDLRHAARMLLQNKGWTAVVVLSLGLGIGANTTLFSAANSLLLQTLPVSRPAELVRLRWTGQNDMVTSSSDYGSSRTASGQTMRATFSYPIYQHLRSANKTLADMLACAPSGRLNVIVNGDAELASGVVVSGNYFSVLGVRPFVGRTLLPEDDSPAAAPVAVISHGYWTRRFGANPGVIGASITVNNTPLTVVGVTPPEYTGIQRLNEDAPALHLPLALDSRINPALPGREGTTVPRVNQPSYWWLQIMGRLKPGFGPEQVHGNLAGVFQQSAREGLASYLATLTTEQRSTSRNRNRTAVPSLDVSSGSHGTYDVDMNTTRLMSILGVVVALVLLLVCANVANLLLSRASARAREISIRLSVGASRARLVRQLLTESVLLAAVGGALGIVIGYWSRRLLPFDRAVPFDWRVFGFVAALSFATGLAFGLVPALRATRVDLSLSLKEAGRSVSASRSLLGKALLVTQVAISLVLLVGAGLFLHTLQNLRAVQVGFDPRNLLIFNVSPEINGYSQERIAALYEQMKEGLRAVPGVRTVTTSRVVLLSGSTSTSSIHVQGGTGSGDCHIMNVSPEFFETIGIRVLAGRAFTPRDDRNAPKVAMINETAARQIFAGGSPLGRRFGYAPEQNSEYEIVGVLADTKYNSLRDAPPPTTYFPQLQGPLRGTSFLVRTAVEPRSLVPAVREAIRRIDPNLPVPNFTTQAEQVEKRFADERLFALACSLFAGLALVVACVGLFGLMSYSVARRTNEIGIRMALGAERRHVVVMVLRESLTLVGAGAVLGLGSALGASRLVRTLLFGLTPNDPATIAAAVVVMLLVAAVAAYIPARRASRVDPMVALHYE